MPSRSISRAQRARVRQAIRDGHLAFLAEVFGPDAIDRVDYDRLRASGVIHDDKPGQDAASATHALGTLSGDAQAMESPDEFWRLVADDVGVAAEAEREAVAVMRDRIGEYVRALSARLEQAAGHAMTDAAEASRRRRLTSSQPGAPASQEVLARVKKAVAELRRDWLRVAHTELHSAAEEAKAIALARRAPGRDPRVFKRPRPDACAFCRMLFLKPDGVTPRVFRLSALLANGSNVGRRAGRPARSGKGRTEWKAVLGAVHPFCGCELFVLADGMGFDRSGALARVAKSVELEDAPGPHACEER